jgi:hypothetical protein
MEGAGPGCHEIILYKRGSAVTVAASQGSAGLVQCLVWQSAGWDCGLNRDLRLGGLWTPMLLPFCLQLSIAARLACRSTSGFLPHRAADLLSPLAQRPNSPFYHQSSLACQSSLVRGVPSHDADPQLGANSSVSSNKNPCGCLPPRVHRPLIKF